MSKFELEIVKLKVFNANVYNMYAQHTWIVGISMENKSKKAKSWAEDNKRTFIIMRLRKIAKRLAKQTKQLKAKCGSFFFIACAICKIFTSKISIFVLVKWL